MARKREAIVVPPPDIDDATEVAEVRGMLEDLEDEFERIRLAEPHAGKKLHDMLEFLRKMIREDVHLIALRKDMLEFGQNWARQLESMARPDHEEYITTVTELTLEQRQAIRHKQFVRYVRAQKEQYGSVQVDPGLGRLRKEADYKLPGKQVRDHQRVKAQALSPENIRPAVKKIEEIVQRISVLWRAWRKAHPQKPMIVELIERLAGTDFTISDAARLAYTIQLERGQVPRSSNARLRQMVDPQNVRQALHDRCANMRWNEKDQKYAIPKEFKLSASGNDTYKHSPEKLRQIKERLAAVRRRIAILQRRLGVVYQFGIRELPDYPKGEDFYKKEPPRELKDFDREAYERAEAEFYRTHDDAHELMHLFEEEHELGQKLRRNSDDMVWRMAGIDISDKYSYSPQAKPYKWLPGREPDENEKQGPAIHKCPGKRKGKRP